MAAPLQQPELWLSDKDRALDTDARLRPDECLELQKRALFHYDKSQSADTRSEQTVVHRSHAKNYAYKLKNYKSTQVSALNLLARIALDEGFYDLAEQHLKDALVTDNKNAGCWYSLGHVHLAKKTYNEAAQCFVTALDISPFETKAATSLAYTLACQGNVVKAFQAYRKLIKVHPTDSHIRAKLFEVVKTIQADFYQQDLEEDVLEWLSFDGLDHQSLSPLVMSLLTHKYQLRDPDALIDLQDLIVDPLLSSSLGKLYFTDSELEKFLVILRKQILINAISQEYKDMGILDLAAKMALHSEHNEHIYHYDNSEKDLIVAIKELIEGALLGADTPASSLAHLITLYAMYEPLIKLKGNKSILKEPVINWPEYAVDLIAYSVIYAYDEIETAKTINELAPITDTVSKTVKQQYEENPYPRWRFLDYNTPTNYGRALERELAGYRAPEYFNMGTVRVLIAGSGTGQHALKVARYFRNVEVVAIDLSKRSLAYAKRKAKDYNLNNIEFICADILNLSHLNKKFHVIECSGVLHHMDKPEKGLEQLKSLLEPRGVIKLGLYSYQARKIVRTMRSIISKYDLQPTAQGIRTLRQAILDENMPYDFSGILTSQDFYSLSGCRDLLFHAQETQYEPHELAEILERHKLKFLGFVLKEPTRNKYKNHFPDDLKLINLDNWQAFETENPKTFSGMFQFYVQNDGTEGRRGAGDVD